MLLTGETLREQRECLGISQAEIAKRAGMSRPTIIKYEKNIDQTLTNLLQAYCLEVYPVVGNYHESINELRRITENAIEKSLGVSCKVSIKVELCGEEEMSIEITDELVDLVEEFKHYGTDATARHLAAYICEELDQEEKE